MKPHLAPIFFLLLLLGFSPAVAQPKTSTEEDEMRGLRTNFAAGTVDGLRIMILKAVKAGSSGEKFVPVDPAQIFKAGDKIQIEFESNFIGHVYILNIFPSGQKTVLFPQADMENQITSSRRYTFPSKKGSFIFDEEKGVEILQVLMTRTPIPTLDEAIRKSAGIVTKAKAGTALKPTAAAEAGVIAATTQNQFSDFEPRGILIAKDSNGAMIVGTKRKKETVRTRQLTLPKPSPTPPNPDRNKARKEEVAEGKLGIKDIAIFEIRLKHQ